jgi:nucleoside-diphosphate-sugar epimerase
VNLLILGGTSFLGRHLTESALNQGLKWTGKTGQWNKVVLNH